VVKKVERREPQPGIRERMRFSLPPHLRREIFAVLLITLGLAVLLALFGLLGAVGPIVSNLLLRFIGLGAYLVAAALILIGGLWLVRNDSLFNDFPIAWGRLLAFEILLAALVALAHIALTSTANGASETAASELAANGQGGGYLGYAIASLLTRGVGSTAAIVILVLLTLVGIRFAFDWTPLAVWLAHVLPVDSRPKPVRSAPPQLAPRLERAPTEPKEKSPAQQPKPAARIIGGDPAPVPAPRPTIGTSNRAPLFGKKAEDKVAPPSALTSVDGLSVLAIPRGRPRRRAQMFPSLELLEQTSEVKFAETDANRKARLIEETLDQFGIPAKVVETNAGPSVTQFGIEPGFVERRAPDGTIQRRRVPVNRILALQNDLALALAAAPIRIEAPVPGRSVVGIEVPNDKISVVSLRGVLESDVFKKVANKTPLPLALGRDVSGTAVVTDLVMMPHLLIAGATGSGKSVSINAIIACLLFNNTPDDLRLVLVDPKRVELVNLNGIPHLIGPVITDVSHVVSALRWAVREMENRLQLFSKRGTEWKSSVRNIDAYNAQSDKHESERLPYILIVIDELADLMLAAPEETEKLITRLAQLSRATGIHLILATQRPSVDVVTGLIKANFPARISFAVTSSVDSRVVLDTPGAEKLLGRGDMLFMSPDSAKLVRLQGCFVSDDELARLVHFWREKAETVFHDVTHNAPWEELGKVAQEDDGDDLIEQAVEVIVQSNRASISFLQTKLGIGYPRAARLMDQLEQRGIVGPDEGAGKPRAILYEEPKETRKAKTKK
jgi:S-DNA-T family DNA segregation ATPase FtsK/SpoIIIE